MLRIFLLAVILFHGLIHLIGFAKAFHYAKIDPLTQDISNPMGILWLVTALLFLVVLFVSRKFCNPSQSEEIPWNRPEPNPS